MREVLAQYNAPPKTPSFLPFSQASLPRPPSRRKSDQPNAVARVPPIQRNNSAPLSQSGGSLTRDKEVSRHKSIKKSSLLRYDFTSAPDVVEPLTTSSKESPSLIMTPNDSFDTRREVQTPNIGLVAMKNSIGVAAMLGKRKRKRKESSIQLVAESERIFAGKSFYYVPNDDINPVRKVRIKKAREFGANWAKEVRNCPQ